MAGHTTHSATRVNLSWVAVVFLAGAAAMVPDAGAAAQEPPKISGFLGDYSKLQARSDPALAEHLVYVNGSTNWQGYTGIVIEPVRIFLTSGGPEAGFNPSDIAALTEYFEQALLRELAGAYPLREELRPGALHLRIAITELAPTSPRQSKQGDFVPLMLMARALKGKTLAVNVSAVAIESELLDAATGERLAAVKSRKLGTGTTAEKDNSSSVQEVEAAMDFWAKRIRVFLESAKAPATSR